MHGAMKGTLIREGGDEGALSCTRVCLLITIEVFLLPII